ncbi:MAG: hypothetical protein J7L20_06350 [Thermoplasmata archaeon]|nr:hypothetical protein [Thermoplasmata archaeon]
MISRNGAILLGRNVACDAFAERKVRIVTHAHSDHMLGLEESLRYSNVYATPATAELIRLFKGKEVNALDYGKEMKVENEKFKLFDAGHIIGSAQVLLVDENGKRWVYTGDFRIERAKAIKSDVLIMEATYGNPSNTRDFDVQDEFIKLVDVLTRSFNAIHIFGYHGKLQEIAEVLKDYELYMDPSVYRVAKICEKYGMKFGSYRLKGNEKKGIFLHHMRLAKRIKEGAKVYLTGWEFEKPIRKLSEKEFVVAFSDHSDFNGLLKYVELSDPEIVITDNYRVGDATSLAREIRKRFGIKAIPMP